MKKAYGIILFIFLGTFVFLSLPKEVYAMEEKASKYLALISIVLINLVCWGGLFYLIFKLI